MMNSPSPVQAASPSAAVLDAVADREDVSATELPLLYDAVDPDALDALVGSDDSDRDIRVTFSYHGYEVTVTGDGAVSLDEDG